MQEKVKGTPGSEFTYVGTRPDRPDGVDKVTGRARFGADLAMAGQLVGKVLRSPHAHARIRSIDTSAAAKLPGVKAVITGMDFKDQPSEFIPAGEMMINYKDVVRNVMAREKALYEGHAVAAVAATSAAVAKQALKLIKVDYQVLPHVIDVVEAMQPGAPILHDDMFTAGVEPAPKTASNIAKRLEFVLGDVVAGFKQADLIVEREFTTKPVHQGYIEPHACIASVSEDGQADVWVTTQGHWIVRAHCARLLGWDVGKVRVTSSEIGGGFGGKTVVYLEPMALALSQKARRPVKMVMSREEVFRSSGPTSGAHVRVKIGAKKDGRIVAAEAELKYQAGAFAGSPVQPAACAPTRPTTSRTSRSSATTWSRTGRRWRPIAPRRTDLRVRGRERHRRDRRQDRHGPDRAASQERGQGGHQGRRTGPSSARSAWSRRWKPPRATRTGAPRSRRTRVAASPPASGSTSAARPRCRCR
jgi:CO/xanthine dehydrogenase Mo-binding subunit